MFVEKYKIKSKKTQEYYGESKDNVLIIEDRAQAEETVKNLNTQAQDDEYEVEAFIDNEEF